MSSRIKELFKKDAKPTKGLLPVEWAVMAYLALTLLIMLFMHSSLHNAGAMLTFRLRVVVLTAVTWWLYRLVPCNATMVLRVAIQMIFLADWYPDTYEFNRCFPNLDHIFCGWEQSIFGCQPSLEFSKAMPWGIVSELLDMGYASYYPIIGFTALFYYLYRRQQFQRAVFTIMSAFFLFYIIFIFVPVAGPTFYFRAVGVDIIEQGVFPSIGHYFEYHSDLSLDCLPSPGWQDGLMWKIVEIAKWAGERPTAAFPSSHVGITVVCMLLLWHSGNRRVFFRTLPFAILMFFATFYIQAHYAIDAIAGLAGGALFYIICFYGYNLLSLKKG